MSCLLASVGFFSMLHHSKILPGRIARLILKRNASLSGSKLVLGCGSNVVDQIYKVESVPEIGEKGFFQSATKILEKSVVGGVTLNHLSWGSLLGVPTGLLAFQGTDGAGRIIRKKLNDLNINQDFVHVDKELTTAQSYVFVQRDGERSIIMASGATSLITDRIVTRYFADAIHNHASMLTTEISQVPLSGVIQLLKLAKEAGIMTVVDFDVTPSVAFNEAKLGDLDQLKTVVGLADVLKPSKSAAYELLKLLYPDSKGKLSPDDISKYLREISEAKLVAMTNGSEDTIMATENHLVKVPTENIERVVDATGAGDAFLGGIIAGIYYNGVPSTEDQIRELGELANKTGAANCLVLGGLPEDSSRVFLAPRLKNHPLLIPELDNAVEVEVNPLREFKDSLKRDFGALDDVSKSIDHKAVSKFIDLIFQCRGNVLVSGIGKSGMVAARVAASLSSIGIPSHFVHANEWAHGDLGKIRRDDITLFISHSGNTEEILQAMKLIKRKNVPILAILGYTESDVGNLLPDTSISYGCNHLIEPLGGIPTTSIVLQDAIVNGVLCELIAMKKLNRQDFLFNHPGGNLGKMFLNDE